MGAIKSLLEEKSCQVTVSLSDDCSESFAPFTLNFLIPRDYLIAKNDIDYLEVS